MHFPLANPKPQTPSASISPVSICPSTQTLDSTMEPPFSFHHHPHPHPHAPPQPPPPPHAPPPQPAPPKPSSGEIVFRILCPAARAGGVIGKGGSVIRQLREETGARIRVVDELIPSHCDERVILIVAPSVDSLNPNLSEDDSVAQLALIRVFERILKVDDERNDKVEDERNGGNVVCRMLAPSHQVGCVLGRGGKIVEKIRQESGARVRVLPRENLPACASPGDELIQISGSVHAVKKALLSVSSCLQEHPRADMFHGANFPSPLDSFSQRGLHASGHHPRGFSVMSMSEKFGPNHGMATEEEVVFRLLCQGDKIGSLIGKGGSVIRGIENETGASIKIGDAVAPDSDERVVVILARESFDFKRSSAQDAVIRVHSRIAEVGFEPGAAVVARLLVHSQQIGCLLGKGGHIIAEMRRLTGAIIRIGREQGLKFNTPNDEVVQVTGSLQTVQDALFQITSRLREIVFPSRPLFPEFPSPSFRPRHDQALSYGYDNWSVGQGQAHPSLLPHGTDRIGGANNEQECYHYVGDGASYGPPFEQPRSPRAWYPQPVNNENPSGYSDAGPGPSGRIVTNSESSQMPITTSVEVSVPQILLPHVFGENRSNLGHITQFSGADVVVHDPKPGASEGLVVISGTPSQCRTAQSLIHAFILSGQAF